MYPQEAMTIERFLAIDNRYGIGRSRLDAGTKQELLRVIHELIAEVRCQRKINREGPLDPAKKTCSHCGHWFLAHRSDTGCTFCRCGAGRAVTDPAEPSAAPEDRPDDEEAAAFDAAITECRTDPTAELRKQLVAATARAERAEAENERLRQVEAVAEQAHADNAKLRDFTGELADTPVQWRLVAPSGHRQVLPREAVLGGAPWPSGWCIETRDVQYGNWHKYEPTPSFLITTEDTLSEADAEQLRADVQITRRPEANS